MYSKVGECKRCGAPIYAPGSWGGTCPPPSQHSCNCFSQITNKELSCEYQNLSEKKKNNWFNDLTAGGIINQEDVDSLDQVLKKDLDEHFDNLIQEFFLAACKRARPGDLENYEILHSGYLIKFEKR